MVHKQSVILAHTSGLYHSFVNRKKISEFSGILNEWQGLYF